MYSAQILEYYANLAEEGDWNAGSTLTNIFQMGTRTIDQDPAKVLYYLEKGNADGHPAAAGQLAYLKAVKLHKDTEKGKPYNATLASEILKLQQYALNRGDSHGLLAMGFMIMKVRFSVLSYYESG